MTKILSVASIAEKIKSHFGYESDKARTARNDEYARKLLSRSKSKYYAAFFEYEQLKKKGVNLHQDEIQGLVDVRSRANALLSSIRLCAVRTYLEDLEHSDLSEEAKAFALSSLIGKIDDILPQAETTNIFQKIA